MKDVRVRVGAQLREWRQRRQLTQERLAERAGLSYKFVGEIERGAGNPTIQTLSRLAAALDVDLAELLRAAEPGKAPTAAYTLSATEVQVVRDALVSLDHLISRLEGTTVYPRSRRRK